MGETKRNPIYLPTKAEERLLAALCDPANRMLNIKEMCKAAKINPDTYYVAFKKEGFCEMYRAASIDILRRSVAPMINALTKEACRGNAQHLKMGLEITDVYAEKHEVLTESYAERLARLRQREKK